MSHHNSVLAYIGLGSNIGDREQYLKEAIHRLHQRPSIEVVCCSSIYETEPVGYTDQDCFLNMVIAVRTSHTPNELFQTMMDIEQQLGRTREQKWGPRTIDLDLLMFGDEQLQTPDLIIPHPRMHERGFVLIPLQEVLRKCNVLTDERFDFNLDQLTQKEGVRLWKQIDWPDGLELFAN